MKEGWKIKKFDEIIQSSLIGVVKNNKAQSPEFEFRYLKMNNIKNDNGLKEESFTFVNATNEEVEKYSLKENDFLFNTRNSYELVGKTCLYKSDYKKPTLFNNNILRVTFKDYIDPQFVANAFSTASILKDLEKMKSGTTSVVGIYYKSLKNLQISFPPLSEQKQIVAILDTAFEAIDQAKVNIEKNIENAKELFQSKLNEIFSQKGEGWDAKQLGEICENLDNKRIPITKHKRQGGSIPYYGASGIVDYVADFIFDEDLLLVSEDGANLLARTYPIAFSISGKTWVNNHAHALRFGNMTNQKYVEYYLNSIKLDDFISGMAQPKLNQAKLNSIPIPYPNLDIQEQIIFKIDLLDKGIKRIRKSYQIKLGALEELKKSILQKAFAGELTNKMAEV